MVKNYYVPKDKQSVLKEAENLFKHISPVIISGLENEIKKEKEALQFKEYIIDDAGLRVTLIGKKLFTYPSNNDQNISLKEENELGTHFEITGYMTK